MTFVDRFALALGPHKFSVEESASSGRTFSAAADLRAAGFEWHHTCRSESAYDLALDCVRQMGDLGTIDAIVWATALPFNGSVGDERAATTSGDVKPLMDFPASRLQSDLGLDTAFVVGINQQACTGMLGALRIASALVTAEPVVSRVLCVTADRFPSGARYEQAYNLISDGAAACLVTRDEAAYRLRGVHQITHGGLVHAGDDETVGSWFSWTHRAITEGLAKAGVGDVDWVVAQNTNRKAWEVMSRLLRIEPGRVRTDTQGDAGHVISGDNIANLIALEQSGDLHPGTVVMLVMAGYGMNWQTAVLERVA